MQSPPKEPVLVVEDHADVREMVQTYLELEGYTVCTAVHGLEALKCLEEERPCIILLDLMMPVMDGPTFARRLRQHPDPELASTPVILLTALPDAAKIQREIGALDLIPKPVDFDRVTETVARHCHHSES